MKQKYIVVEDHDRNGFEMKLNAHFTDGYRLISHALAIDTNEGSNTMTTYSAVMEMLIEN